MFDGRLSFAYPGSYSNEDEWDDVLPISTGADPTAGGRVRETIPLEEDPHSQKTIHARSRHEYLE